MSNKIVDICKLTYVYIRKRLWMPATDSYRKFHVLILFKIDLKFVTRYVIRSFYQQLHQNIRKITISIVIVDICEIIYFYIRKSIKRPFRGSFREILHMFIHLISNVNGVKIYIIRIFIDIYVRILDITKNLSQK